MSISPLLIHAEFSAPFALNASHNRWTFLEYLALRSDFRYPTVQLTEDVDTSAKSRVIITEMCAIVKDQGVIVVCLSTPLVIFWSWIYNLFVDT